MARLKVMRDRGEEPQFPPCSHPHIIEWWLEIGPSGSNGMGETPLDWREIEAWSVITGIELEAWEARLIRRLSSEFISQRHDARQRGCPAPYQPDDTKQQNPADAQIAALFQSMAVLAKARK